MIVTELQATEEMATFATFARFRGIVDPLQLFVGRSFMREEIPPLFGVEFKPGNWNSGHVVLGEQGVHVLLGTSKNLLRTSSAALRGAGAPARSESSCIPHTLRFLRAARLAAKSARNGFSRCLLVTLNKQGKSQDHRYHDYFIDPHRFHWQSQNSTTPDSQKGRALIDHEARGIRVHLFVRDHKLLNGKAAPFRYHGPVRYVRHSGSAPMSIEWELRSGA